MRAIRAAAVVVGMALGPTAAAPARDWIIEVEAGPHDRRATPVIVSAPDGVADAGTLLLIPLDLDGGRPVRAQLVPGERPAVAFLLGEMPAGAKHRWRLTASGRPGTGDAGRGLPVSIHDDGEGQVLSYRSQRSILRYHDRTIEPPAGIDPLFARSGFIHPLWTPSGRVVTDDFPPDHAHQHGLFFAWVNAEFAGHKVDFWNQAGRTGRVRHAEMLGTQSGPVFGGFRARLRHEDISGAEPVPVLDEVWTVRAYARDDLFLIDFESVQTCAGSRPLEVLEYHYGGLGLRGARGWFDPKVKGDNAPDPERSGGSDFLTGEGKGRANGNHTRPRWVDLSGRVDGQPAGVAILDHPENFRAPQPVRLHPTKPYFAFSPMVLGGFAIEPGRPYVSRYRLILHDGPPDPEAIDRAWRDYAEPPRARIVEE